MSHKTPEERKARERDHGKSLAPDAERIWGPMVRPSQRIFLSSIHKEVHKVVLCYFSQR